MDILGKTNCSDVAQCEVKEEDVLTWRVESPYCCWGGRQQRSPVGRRFAAALAGSVCARVRAVGTVSFCGNYIPL